jgi:hypothetical protein
MTVSSRAICLCIASLLMVSFFGITYLIPSRVIHLADFKQNGTTVEIYFDREPKQVSYLMLTNVPAKLDHSELRKQSTNIAELGNRLHVTIPFSGEPNDGEYSIETFARNTAKQLIINRTHPVK